MSSLSSALTIGVEEEFQIVSSCTAELVNGYEIMMKRATPAIRKQLKSEFLQCVVESITKVCDSVDEIRDETRKLRATAMQLTALKGMQIVSAGTNPTGLWYEQHRTNDERYDDLVRVLEDVARSILIYGHHIHIGMENQEQRLRVMNQARTYLPHILALSANSPFWMGRPTGYASFRTMVWAPFPMSGVPESFATEAEFDNFQALMKKTDSINDTRRIWWDIRPHHEYMTAEFRIADMPIRHSDMLAITAFVQALVKTIIDANKRGIIFPTIPSIYINENRWRAARHGLQPTGNLIDYTTSTAIPTLDAVFAAFDLVQNAAEELGTVQYLHYFRKKLSSKYKNGAEEQIAVYERRHNPLDVTRRLMEATREGFEDPAALAMPLADKPSPLSSFFRIRHQSEVSNS